MLADSKLTSHHRLPLHLVHVFLILLTVLFLILGGVSGPETGYWWIQVTYADGVGMGGSSTGGSWSLGGLGACVAGENCKQGQDHPPHWTAVHGALSWHIAAALLFLALALTTYLLILFPPRNSMALHWWTLFLPPLGVLLPVIALIVDICVKRGISAAKDVKHVDTKVSFWLSTMALIVAILWSGLAEYIRWLALRKVDPPSSPVGKLGEKPGVGRYLRPWWPWGKQ